MNSLTEGNKKDRASYCKALFDRTSVQGTNLPNSEDVTNYYQIPLKKPKQLKCYFCISFLQKNHRTKYGCPVCKVGFCYNKSCHSYIYDIEGMSKLKDSLVIKNEEKENPCISLVKSLQINYPTMDEDTLNCITSNDVDVVENVFNCNRNCVSISRKNSGHKGGIRRKNVDQDIEHSGMYEDTSEENEKSNNKWGEYRLLREQENEIDLGNGNDNYQLEFN